MQIQAQVANDYLAAYKAANGQDAQLKPAAGGVQVVAADGHSTGIVYTEVDLVRLTTRLRTRAAVTHCALL